jgi:hypothetical protein
MSALPVDFAALRRRFLALRLRHRGLRHLLWIERYKFHRQRERQWAVRELIRLDRRDRQRALQTFRGLIRSRDQGGDSRP